MFKDTLVRLKQRSTFQSARQYRLVKFCHGRTHLNISPSRDWLGFKYFTPSSLGHQVVRVLSRTGKRVVGPAESGGSPCVETGRKTIDSKPLLN